MRPVVRDAGSRRRFVQRTVALAAGVAVSACGDAVRLKRDVATWLEPLHGFLGGVLTDRVDPTGMPLPGGNETSFSFLAPEGVVSVLGSLFIADAGYGRVFRLERGTGLMAAVPGLRIASGTKLRAGQDGTLHVLDPLGTEIRRLSLHGASLPAMHARLPTSRYLDFVVEGATGRVLAVDSVHKVIDRIEPVGRAAIDILEIDAMGPVALLDGAILLADNRCACVNEFRDGRLVRRLGQGSIRQPVDLVVDRGEVYLLDAFDRSISRVYEGGLESIFPAQLDLISPKQIFVSNGIMHVADPAKRAVSVFRIHRRLP